MRLNTKQRLESVIALILPHKLTRLGIGSISTNKRELHFGLYITIEIPDKAFGKNLCAILQKVINNQFPKKWTNGGSKETQKKEIEKDFPMDMINR